MRLLDERLLLSGALLLALALAHVAAALRTLTPATGPHIQATGAFGRLLRCGHAQLALVLVGIAGLEWSLVHAFLEQRLAGLMLVPAYLAGCLATWWLCFESAEKLRLAAMAVAMVGVWLLA